MELERLCPHCMGERQEGQNICPHCGKDANQETEVQHQLKPFTILMGKYLVGDVIGEGGFGITYVGFDLNLETRVAIKEFYPNGYVTREAQVTSMLTAYTGQSMDTVHKWRDSFVKEARTLAKFTGLSGIVGVKDFFQENNTAYIIMEYLEGETLKSYMQSRGGKIPADELLYMMKPVIASLDEVHKAGLIHRDISPDNLMLLKGGQIKLLDFGAARDYTANGEKSLSVLLKPGYAPEEQYRTKGKQGPWSDVYALCATMYKCITGVTPPESMERMREDELKHLGELGVSISPQVENALIKGMAVFAENRCQSMSELYDMLYGQEKEQSVQPTQIDDKQAEGLPALKKTTDEMTSSGLDESHGSEKKKDMAELFRKYQKGVCGGAAGLAAALLFLFIGIKAGNASRDDQEEGSRQESVAATVQASVAPQESQVDVRENSSDVLTDDVTAEVMLLTEYQAGLNMVALDGIEYGVMPANGVVEQTYPSDLAGICVSRIIDLDQDGEQELLAIRLENGYLGSDVYADIYECRNMEIVLADTSYLFNTGCEAYWFRIFLKDGRYLCADLYNWYKWSEDGIGYAMNMLAYDGLGWSTEIEETYYAGDDHIVEGGYDLGELYYPGGSYGYLDALLHLESLGMSKTAAKLKENTVLCYDETEDGLEQIYQAEAVGIYDHFVRGDMWFYGFDPTWAYRNSGSMGKLNLFHVFAYSSAEERTESGIVYNTEGKDNYSNSLDYTQYARYTSQEENFNFSYSKSLYNRVLVNTNTFDTENGTNQITITMRGQDYSEAVFAQYYRDQSYSIDETYESLLDYYSNQVRNAYVLRSSTGADDGEEYHGRIVITGNGNECMAYIVIAIWQDKVQVMWIQCPFTLEEFRDANDAQIYQYASYVTECMYRMCDFSGSTVEPRSYAQFIQ